MGHTSSNHGFGPGLDHKTMSLKLYVTAKNHHSLVVTTLTKLTDEIYVFPNPLPLLKIYFMIYMWMHCLGNFVFFLAGLYLD